MKDSPVRRELDRFDPTLPLEAAWTPSGAWYILPDFYALERETVFANNWLIAARADQVDTPGRFVCGDIAGERYIVVRDNEGILRSFHNVCRHHAAAVATGEGTARRFSCPYHGWTYGLDGKLINAPATGDLHDFNAGDFGLVPLAVAEWGPFVFVHIGDGPTRSLRGDLDALEHELNAMDVPSLRFVARRRYELSCNWKVYIDNYLDGGYHVAYLHRGLASQLDLASYRTDLHDRFSIQRGDSAGEKRRSPQGTSDFAERVGDRVLYAWVYPNFMINRYGSIMDTNWVLPLGPERTAVIFDYYFMETEGVEAEAFISRSIEASDVVQAEDTGICEAVQRGLGSRSYDRGRYSAIHEAPAYHFHRLLRADLLGATK